MVQNLAIIPKPRYFIFPSPDCMFLSCLVSGVRILVKCLFSRVCVKRLLCCLSFSSKCFKAGREPWKDAFCSCLKEFLFAWQCKLTGVKQGEGILCSCCQKVVSFTRCFHSVLEVLMTRLTDCTIWIIHTAYLQSGLAGYTTMILMSICIPVGGGIIWRMPWYRPSR